MEEKEKSFTIYKHTNKKNGKVYIGLTSLSPKRRWDNGRGYKNSYFGNAIRKYGWSSFKHEILFKGLDREEAQNKEIEMISFYNSSNRLFGYNISKGGYAPNGEDSPNYGKKQSEETINKRMKNIRGAKNYQARKVIEIRSKEIFECITYAQNKYGIALENIIKCCNGERKHAGIGNDDYYLIWMYYEDYCSLTKEQVMIKISDSINKKIKCIDTDEIFVNAKRAGTKFQIASGNIAKCCIGERKTAGGYRWEFVEEGD